MVLPYDIGAIGGYPPDALQQDRRSPFDVDALLERPWRDQLRHLDRSRCAALVDARLRLLARRQALGRRVLGRLAAVFLRHRAHHRLGFARLGDYTRERLGLSAREVQTLARVVAALDRLPILAAAFHDGELSWTQVRILVDVATVSTERAWVGAARGLTARALEKLVHSTHPDEEPDPKAIDALDSPCSDQRSTPNEPPRADEDPDGDTLDGERPVRFRLLCPRGLPALWRAVVELARRMTGEPLPEWRAAEVIAAEGLSGAPQDASGDHAVPTIGGEVTPPTPLPGTRVSTTPHASRRAVATTGATTAAPVEWTPANGEAVVGTTPTDEETVVGPLAMLEALGNRVDTLDAFALDERLRAVISAMHAIDWETGRLLRLAFDLRLYALLGFGDTASYVRAQLGFSVRKARALVAVERATWRAPALAEAYRTGHISWLRALLITPVLRESTAAAWVERAGAVTVRRLIDEVDWARTMQDLQPLCYAVAPPPFDTRLDITEVQMRALPDDDGIDSVLTFHGPASVVALFHSAIAAFTAPGECAWRGCERLLAHARAEWERQPRHRDPIFARDGWRCAVPACSSRRNLHDHHVLFRSRHGGNAPDNRIAICAAHHQHGIHGGGYVRAWGRAPDAMHWELGIRSGAPPLLTLEGDRYVALS